MNARPVMFSIGYCPLCETGPLGLRRCGGCGAVVVLCDECDTVWPSADFTRPPRGDNEETLPCPVCEASLIEAPSGWATREEIDATPWIVEGVASGRLKLEQGEPLSLDPPHEDAHDGPEPGDAFGDAGG